MAICRRTRIVLALVLFVSLLSSTAHAARTEAALSPDEQQRWAELGFSAEDALSWRRVGIGPAEAHAWVRAGVQFAEWANQWKGEGFGPADAAKWVRAANVYTAGEFRKRGFSVAEATAWMAHGVRSALRAEEFRKIGLTPEEAGRWWKLEFFPGDIPPWKDAGFGPEEALAWKYGAKEYFDDGVGYSRAVFSVDWARQWRDVGFTPEESRRARLIGIKLSEAIEWKRAGFDLREGVQWRDSGFGPDEAKRLRAAGLDAVAAEERRDEAAARPEDEIASLHADIHLLEDGAVLVTERFVVLNRPGGPIRGCFERVLPSRIELRYWSSSFRSARPTYDRIGAALDGSPATVSVVRDSHGDRTLCIGANGSPLTEGSHVITVSYITEDRLIMLRDHEELFFDVTGPALRMPVRRATATVRLPRGADVVFADGFAGLRDRKDFIARVRALDGADVVEYAVWRPLKQEMGFQVSIGLTKGFVKASPWNRARHFDRRTGRLLTSLVILVLGLTGTLAYYIIAWRRVGRDPAAGLVLREFEPPAGASPALIRYIVKRRRVDDTSIAATLVRLAQQGAIRIDEQDGAYRIRKAGPVEGCAPDEHQFLAELLGAPEGFVLGVARARAVVARARTKMKQALEAEYRRHFVSNSRYLWPGVLLCGATVVSSLLVLDLRDGRKAELFLAVYSAFQIGILGTLCLVFWFLLKTPTQEGRKLLERIAGYRETLAANLWNRATGVRDPGVVPSLARHLPYAMALGFECDRVGARRDATRWFTGGSGSFSARDFTASIRRRARGGREPA